MKTIALAACLLPVASAFAGLEKERQLLQSDPAKASAHFQEKLASQPSDPWLAYNTGVAAYAAHDFAKADELWQQLATTPLPETLREQTWLQIGNVSYRLVQDQLEKAPDLAVGRLEQAREAYRIVLAANKGNKIASQNLALVERELERIYALLAKRLAEEGRKESWAPKAIEKLQAALTYSEQAESLNPKNPERQQERKEIEKSLGEKFDERAASEEKVADQQNPDNQWQRQNAQEHLENALSDFQQAQALNQQDNTAREGEKRVKEKLANLFDKAGRDDQRQAEQMVDRAPESALQKLEDALDNFQEALAIQPEHQDAQAGEKEVREQLENLHLQQGDRQAQRGRQQMERNPEQAAQNLTAALENFQAAQELDPQNPEIPPRIESVESILPDLLTQVGQRQQERGERAEQNQDLPNAIENFENAESNFAQAQQMAPENQQARQGQQESQAALERLRQQMAQQSQQQQQGQPQPTQQQQQQAQESFQSMLARVKDDEKDRESYARHHRGQKYKEERDKNLRNW